jgi:16S rRNA (cytidine1402-2'-O)-methyltransferase
VVICVGLTLVPTPLGNLGDLTIRAKQALAQADLIAAEDTRHTGQLLSVLELRKPMISLHDHNEVSRIPYLLENLREGKSIALVSDAGMPLISDPGYRLVRAVIDAGLPLTVLPGPSAILTALAGSGLPPYPFYFGGFLPVKSGKKESELRAAIQRGCTHVYFESPFRIVKTLETLSALAPDASVCVARELTKKFEEFRRGKPAEVAEFYTSHPPKGEITIVLSPRSPHSANPSDARAEEA